MQSHQCRLTSGLRSLAGTGFPVTGLTIAGSALAPFLPALVGVAGAEGGAIGTSVSTFTGAGGGELKTPLCQAIATPLAMASAITAATTLPVLEGLSGFTNDISLSTKKRPTRRGARVQCHGLASRRICQLHCFLKEVY